MAASDPEERQERFLFARGFRTADAPDRCGAGLTGSKPETPPPPVRYTRSPSATIGEYLPERTRHTSLPVRASNAYVPGGPDLTWREPLWPQCWQVEK